MPLSLTLHSHLWCSAALLIACQLPNQRSCKTTRLNWRSLFVIVIWSWQNGKQYFEEINVYFVINGDLFENWLFAFEASHIAIWNIKHDQLDTDLQDYAQTWGDKNNNKTRPKSISRCSGQTYCHISMRPNIFDTKKREYGIFVAKMGKYGIFVAQICKYGIFCHKIL